MNDWLEQHQCIYKLTQPDLVGPNGKAGQTSVSEISGQMTVAKNSAVGSAKAAERFWSDSAIVLRLSPLQDDLPGAAVSSDVQSALMSEILAFNQSMLEAIGQRIEMEHQRLQLGSNHTGVLERLNRISNPGSSKTPWVLIFLLLCCTATVVGNLLVLGAVTRVRSLRTVTNYLIVSLACADLIIGLIVMPFSIAVEVTNGVWPFGPWWCDLWHSFDVLASTASILNLCAISLDRYIAVTSPVSYPTKMTTSRCRRWIALVWLCSSFISFPAIIWWRLKEDQEQRHETECLFTTDSYYLVISSLISFYIPLFIMVCVYTRVYQKAVHQSNSLKKGTKRTSKGHVLRVHRGGQKMDTCTNVVAIDTASVTCTDDIKRFNGTGEAVRKASLLVLPNEHPLRSDSSNATVNNDCTVTGVNASELGTSYSPMSRQEGVYDNIVKLPPGSPEDSWIARDDNTLDDVSSSNRANSDGPRPALAWAPAGLRHLRSQLARWKNSALNSRYNVLLPFQRRLAQFSKEHRAAKTLGIVMGVFILCWTPFFVLNIILALCGEGCIHKLEVVAPVATWLGYVNSCCNPLIYAHSMKDYRSAFIRILCCTCRRFGRQRSSRRWHATGSRQQRAMQGRPSMAHRPSHVVLATANGPRLAQSLPPDQPLVARLRQNANRLLHIPHASPPTLLHRSPLPPAARKVPIYV